ncbi:GNAT family N-acetyltransferase [Roseateles terrae]|uniref:Phosphinothricin acetyltransferase n=1 Tax=Roseateles terrae TaxID=431060 RepID=A0ABR6GQY8_9BURK|nr:GNAT family N-acetyltransferase [Roseateles terrae]MBB3194440.1 phosphinothricin acetyltransferase [Roseateles terrae]OWQ88267.1 hypothetical protein CDN98_09090 [Roseateles terrae]
MMSALPPFTWRRAHPEDVPALTRIYNESVDGGGHSPALCDASEQGLAHLMKESRTNGWPLWVLAHGNELVGWAYVRRIAWGGAACGNVGDIWLYVAKAWHRKGIPMQMLRRVHPELLPHGFDIVTCWVLGSNRASLALVRACRLQRWACLPQVVRYGDRVNDLEIWGVRADDPQWQRYMRRLDQRYRRLEAKAALEAAQAEPSCL